MIGNTCRSVEVFKPLLVCIFQSSLAAARADNFYYPPEWTPKQVHLFFNHISAVTILQGKYPYLNVDARIFRFSR